MKIDIENLKHFHEIGGLVQGEFGDARETACLVSSLTGITEFEQCSSVGWPQWLAELTAHIFDNAPASETYERSFYLAHAIKAADDAGVDFDEVFRAIRLDSILPIALEAIGEGDEPWRVDCHNVVQRIIDDNGEAAEAARAAEATWATARAAEAVEATWAAEAAWAAARAAGAAWTAGAAGAAWAAANTRIYESTVKCLLEAAQEKTKRPIKMPEALEVNDE